MEHNKELTIWQTYHKEELIDEFSLKEDEYFRLFNSNDLTVEGENINHLNRFYSEMVTMYWVWRNQKRSRLVGFCHYRRKFTHLLEPTEGEVVVFDRVLFAEPLWKHYKISHNFQDFYDIIDILNDRYGKDNKYSDYLLNSHVFIPFCSFIMHYEDFESMCAFLFPVLFEFDRLHGLNMDPVRYQAKAERDFRYDDQVYQARAMSFLAERLISAYLICNMSVVMVCALGTKLYYE